MALNGRSRRATGAASLLAALLRGPERDLDLDGGRRAP